MRLQLFFQSRTENARLDPRAARHGVDFENLVEVAQVDYDDPGKASRSGPQKPPVTLDPPPYGMHA